MTLSPSTSTAPEAIFVRIDLEASLGRIEDEPPMMNSGCAATTTGDDQAMDCAGDSSRSLPQPQPFFRNTRTSSKTPFSPEISTSSIAPYPVTETENEIKERQRLLELSSSGLVVMGVETFLQQLGTPPATEDNHSMMEVTATDSPLDVDDDFSLEDDDGSLAEAAASSELERIDRVSFWEESVASLPTMQQHQHMEES
ncbi:MAG: hypothetical protein SGILL_007880 [Bacillariaceae sp.]